MKTVGIWPEERKWNRPSSYVFFIPFITMLCFLWVPQTINLPLIAHDLNLVAENLSMGNMTVTVALAKAISLLRCITKDWAAVETETGRERMVNIAKITRKITIGSSILCHTVISTYVVLRPFSLKYTENKLFFRGYFPYDVNISPNYELTMIGQAVAVTFSTVFYSTVDTFIAMLILHACGQLSNLKEDLMKIHLHDKNNLHMKLKEIVQKHEYVSRFTGTIENCFNVIFLIQMLGFMIQMSFQSFQTIMSIGIADSAYNCEWYSLPPKNARLLVIIMCRAVSSPLKLTAGKFCWFTILLYSQVNLNYLLSWNRHLMKYMGIWPEERKWNRPSNYIVLGPILTMMYFVCVPQTINLPLIAYDLNLVVENLSMALKSLLMCVTEDWATAETKSERETMLNIAKINRKITISCTLVCETVGLSFVVLRLLTTPYRDDKLIYRGYFFYNTTVSPNFELTLIGQVVAVIYVATTYAAVDNFIVLLVLHACGQLLNLKDNLRNLHLGASKDIQARLEKIVEKHNYIAGFTETVESSFNVMFLLAMLACVIQLCFQSFQAIMSVGEEVAKEYMIFQISFLCYYVSCSMMQLYVYCYVGEKLMFESTDVADTAYNCEWYSLPPKHARLLITIMCRARASPLIITAGKFCWFNIIFELPVGLEPLLDENYGHLAGREEMEPTFELRRSVTVPHNTLFRNLLKCMANDWATVETKTGRKIMVNIAGISRKITITCISLCYSANVAYGLLRLVFIKSNDNKLFFHGYFPYDVTISPNFERTVFGQAIAMICSTTIYSTVDTFITMLVLHACGQLSNLKENLMKIHSYDKNNLHMKLKEIVQKHEYVNRFSETVENCFNVMLLIQMLGSIIQVCFQTFQGIMELEQYMIFQLVFLSLYTVSVMVQLLLYCYIDLNILYQSLNIFQSTDIADTAYNCQWYSLPPKDARLLLIIMCRSVSSPLKLTAGKFCWFTIMLYSQCGWNRYLMKIIGIWPEERKWNQPSSYVILLPFVTMLCFLWGPQTVNLPLIIHDLDLVVENLSLANMTFTIALTKAVIFWRKGEALRSLLKCMANDWDTVEDGSEREKMEYIARINRTVTACCMTLSYMVIISYTLVRLIFMKCNDCKLFIRGYFPYDTTTSPNYEVTMIGQAIALTCSATFYSTVDTFITMLILHACGQLSNLKENIMNIYSSDKNDIHMKLKKIVERHEYVNRDCRRLFQRDAFNSDARVHLSNMLPDFSSYHGTKKIILFSKLPSVQQQQKKVLK
ncbi:hypothetical protein E2986_07059 [Frieseomelitta varia]|uniref:Odorant receptor 13a n=1 Tax=Frieseomelitta varia TaxID=561572 RepID=A0A833VS73_9HYME|nr:hypothetical protein E2986_07059 [Frieseomelitta varia]